MLTFGAPSLQRKEKGAARKLFAYVREREAARKAKMAVVRSNPHLVKLILNDTELDVVVAARAGSALRLRHKHVREPTGRSGFGRAQPTRAVPGGGRAPREHPSAVFACRLLPRPGHLGAPPTTEIRACRHERLCMSRRSHPLPKSSPPSSLPIAQLQKLVRRPSIQSLSSMARWTTDRAT